MKTISNKAKFTIVIPTIRENNINEFLSKWQHEFKGQDILIIEDNPTKTFNLPSWVAHFSWEDIDKELGKDSWIIPRRVAGIRSYGFLKAWQKKSQYILTLDDDCLPEKYEEKFLSLVEKALETKWDSDQWWNTVKGFYPRGYPYKIRKLKQETIIHHGLWSNIPDLDGITQKQNPNLRTEPFAKVEKVPFGKFYSMCSMNLSFKIKAVPMLYFLLMSEDRQGNKWEYDRFDDIWAGIFSKKIADHLGFAISSGAPSVIHTRASNVDTNIQKEKKGIEVNEWIWEKISKIKFHSNDLKGCYLEVAEEIENINPYFKKLSQAMKTWISLLK